MTVALHPTGTFEGDIWWADCPEKHVGHVKVDEIIVAVNRIDFGFTEAKDDDKVRVVLKPAYEGSTSWVGEYRYRDKQRSNTVDAQMYTSVDGGIVLTGVWREYGKDLDWFIKMSRQP